MNEEDFSFDLKDDITPDKVIADSLSVIEKSTKGYVKGNISEYNGRIQSYSKEVTVPKKSPSSVAAMITDMYGPKTETRTIEVDIQDSLGEIGNDDHRFEVYLTVKGMDKYKYRMMFVDYTSVSYPVTIVLNDDLLQEYRASYNDTFKLKTVKEVQDMMDAILNSGTLKRLIQDLINEAIRIERKSER